MKSVIYPGSFDPLTNGHVDIIERALKRFEHVIIAVSNNGQKNHVFDIATRVDFISQSVAHLKHIEVVEFKGLLVDYAQKRGVQTMLRGLRAVSDFDYEFQLAARNRKLAPDIESVFLMTGESQYFVSSSLVREIAKFGGKIDQFVPKPVAEALKSKLCVDRL